MSWVSSCALSLDINFLIPSLSKREFPFHFYPWVILSCFYVWGPAVAAEDKVCSAALALLQGFPSSVQAGWWETCRKGHMGSCWVCHPQSCAVLCLRGFPAVPVCPGDLFNAWKPLQSLLSGVSASNAQLLLCILPPPLSMLMCLIASLWATRPSLPWSSTCTPWRVSREQEDKVLLCHSPSTLSSPNPPVPHGLLRVSASCRARACSGKQGCCQPLR